MANVDIIQFNGGMDLDSPPEVIQKGFVRSARNVITRGTKPNIRYEAVLGTTLIPNSFLPNIGTNLTIHAHYDAVNKRVFFFNYNSAGSHAIFIYNTLIGTFQRLIQTGINTNGDPLGFTLNQRIHSVDIFYGDDNSGDLLFYIDTLGRPTKLNVQRYLAGTYTSISRSYLDVIKPPPVMTPQVTYENDYTVNANNLLNSLWQFAVTYIYDDYEKSVLSSASIVPLPTFPFDPQKNIDKSQNARISLWINAGDPTVRSIRIYGRQTKDGVTSSWMIIETIKKSDLNIADNSIYRYLFYNTGNYVTEDTTYSLLDFDFVPLQANCQALLNGNVLSYAGILEGYNFFNPVLNVSSDTQSPPFYTINGVLFFAAFNGVSSGLQPQIQITLTGAGNNDGSGNPTDLLYPPQNLFVRAKSNGSDISFSYTNAIAVSIATILTGLSNAAIAQGWTIISQGTNTLTLYYPTGSISLESSYIRNFSFISTPYNFPQLVHYPQSAYQYGVKYRDSGQRTNGIISNNQGEITTPATNASNTTIPEVILNLASFKPPLWATYYQIVRTDTLTYNKFLQWVSGSAYSNTSAFVTNQYAYFGISNIAEYNTQINATQGVVSYGFSTGDRIRILGRYAANGTFTPLSLDYAVIGIVTNPNVNGAVQTGTFIQIYYPTADINANFKFDGTSDFQNYEIILYSYKSQNPTGQNVFYEVGQQYGIGNPGTPNAYHKGNVGDNLVKITDGDIFYRPRTIPLGNIYPIQMAQSFIGTMYAVPGMIVNPEINTGLWDIKGNNGASIQAGLAANQYPSAVDNNFLIQNISPATFNIRIQWTIPVNPDSTSSHNGIFALYIKIADSANNITVYQILPNQTALEATSSYNFPVDATIPLPPTGKLWPVCYALNNGMHIAPSTLTLTILRSITIQVFDPSYSDIYNLKTNSDNKPDIINTQALQSFYDTKFRYSEPDITGTNINNTNRFYDINFDEFDKSYGPVQRMIQWQRRLRIAQERKWGEIGVYAKFIKNNTGQTELIVNDAIIQQNNIQYFEGDFGVGNQPDAIAVNGFQIWFADPIRAGLCRLSLDGIQQVSEEFKTQTFAGNTLPNYLNPYTYPYGGNAVILAVFNFVKDRDSEVLFCFQGGNNGIKNLSAQTLAFIERTNLFPVFYDYAPDALVCAENQLILFSNGQLYLQNNSTQYAQYFGNNFLPSVTLIFNDQMPIKKKYMALGYQSAGSKIWTAKNIGDIFTSFINPQTGLQQISQLISQDFEINEGMVYAALLRDWNSGSNGPVSLLEGDYLLGNYLQITLTASDNAFNSIFLPFLQWIASPKNP